MILLALVLALPIAYLGLRWFVRRRAQQTAARLSAEKLLADARAGTQAAADRINAAYSAAIARGGALKPAVRIAALSPKDAIAFQRATRRGSIKHATK